MTLLADALYVITNGLLLKPTRRGSIAAGTSLSRQALELQPPGLVVLLAFSVPRTFREAYEHLVSQWKVDQGEFEDLARTMIRFNLITPARLGDASTQGATASRMGFASLRSHHAMLADTYRVLMYRAAILAHASEKTVVDLGCGTGVLSLFAAQAGARRVYAIEETAIADVADAMFRANGLQDRVTLIRGNSRDVSLEGPADLIVHEIIGNDPIGENILPTIADARRFLAPGGTMIPHRLQVWCVGVSQPDRPQGGATFAARQARQWASMYGLDFEPFAAAIEASSVSFNPPQLRFPEGNGGQAGFDFMTDECLLYDVNLVADQETSFECRRELRVTQGGILAGVLVYFRALLDDRIQVTNSPFMPRTHWGHYAQAFAEWPNVHPGDLLTIRSGTTQTLRSQRLRVDLAGSKVWEEGAPEL